MRQIKFRYWNGYTKAMYPAEYFGLRLDGTFLVQLADENNSFVVTDTSKKDVLMQFIGLTDKNKKEIYEGDILSCEGGYDWPEGTDGCEKAVEVKWDDGSLQFITYCCDCGDEIPLHEYDINEVIGNIYENPELIPQP